VFVGDGVELEGFKEDAPRRGLLNVQFIPFQSRARLSEVLATVDFSIEAFGYQHDVDEYNGFRKY